MSDPLLRERCRQVVQDVAHTQGWRLSVAGIGALTEAILPHVQHSADSTVRTIQKIALNYYLDGPMVQQMCIAGTPEGERLWTEWRGYMLSLARAKGLSAENAEELAQTVYLQAAKALRTFHFGSRLKTYFCGIFINCFRYWARTNQSIEQREQALLVEGYDLEEATTFTKLDKYPSPEEQVIEQLQNTQIQSLVRQEIQKIINSEDFQILYRYYVEKNFIDNNGQQHKWTDKEISEHLELPLNTITSRRLRAVQRLKHNAHLRTMWTQLSI
jgi:RNA polymerase sigma factor (sigma-70 family)